MKEAASIGPSYNALLLAYQKHVSARKVLASKIWEQFSKVLTKYPSIMDFIREHQQLPYGASLQAQFHDALNKEKGVLRARILSIEELSQAFKSHNDQFNAGFDWNSQINAASINEYAYFLSTPREWLSPSDLEIIARVFNKQIIYYPHQQAKKIILYPESKEIVAIQFNGVNHFERLGLDIPDKNLVMELTQKKPEQLARKITRYNIFSSPPAIEMKLTEVQNDVLLQGESKIIQAEWLRLEKLALESEEPFEAGKAAYQLGLKYTRLLSQKKISNAAMQQVIAWYWHALRRLPASIENSIGLRIITIDALMRAYRHSWIVAENRSELLTQYKRQIDDHGDWAAALCLGWYYAWGIRLTAIPYQALRYKRLAFQNGYHDSGLVAEIERMKEAWRANSTTPTPLHALFKKQNADEQEAIWWVDFLDKSMLSCADSQGKTLLYLASQRGWLKLIQALRFAGVKIFPVSTDGQQDLTPLFEACAQGSLEIVHELLSNIPPTFLHEIDPKGQALSHALSMQVETEAEHENQSAIVQFLLQCGSPLPAYLVSLGKYDQIKIKHKQLTLIRLLFTSGLQPSSDELHILKLEFEARGPEWVRIRLLNVDHLLKEASYYDRMVDSIPERETQAMVIKGCQLACILLNARNEKLLMKLIPQLPIECLEKISTLDYGLLHYACSTLSWSLVEVLVEQGISLKMLPLSTQQRIEGFRILNRIKTMYGRSEKNGDHKDFSYSRIIKSYWWESVLNKNLALPPYTILGLKTLDLSSVTFDENQMKVLMEKLKENAKELQLQELNLSIKVR